MVPLDWPTHAPRASTFTTAPAVRSARTSSQQGLCSVARDTAPSSLRPPRRRAAGAAAGAAIGTKIAAARAVDPAAAAAAATPFAAARMPPPPSVPPGGLSTLYVNSVDGGLIANGKTALNIKGVRLEGPETGAKPPVGLQHHPVDWYLDFLVSHGFNAIRLPINHRDVLDNLPVDLTVSRHAPEDWKGLTYLEMLKSFTQKAAEKGMLVMVAAMRVGRKLTKDDEGGGLWFSDDVIEEDTVNSWFASRGPLPGVERHRRRPARRGPDLLVG